MLQCVCQINNIHTLIGIVAVALYLLRFSKILLECLIGLATGRNGYIYRCRFARNGTFLVSYHKRGKTMAVYKLLSDEVVLFKDNCYAEDISIDGKEQDKEGVLILTNYNLVFNYKDAQGEKHSAVFSVNDIKTYNNTPQIKLVPHHPEKVEVYLKTDELYLTFDDKKLAKNFVHDAMRLFKVTPTFDETLAKIKKGLANAKQVIDAIDDTLGIDTVEMAKTAVVASASKQSTGKRATVTNALKSAVLTGVKAIDTGVKSYNKKKATQLPAQNDAVTDELPVQSTEEPDDE